jgi:hypothetical protein
MIDFICGPASTFFDIIGFLAFLGITVGGIFLVIGKKLTRKLKIRWEIVMGIIWIITFIVLGFDAFIC